MALSEAAIRAMVDAGCTAEQIAAVVTAELREAEAEQAARRERARDKKRRQREDVSPDVPGTSGDSEGQRGTDGDTPPPSSSPSSLKEKSPLDPPKENNPTTPTPSPTTQRDSASGDAVAKGHDYPDDFEEFWKVWKKQAKGGGGKFEAFGVWKKLTAAEKQTATELAVPFFVKWRKDCPDASPLHAVRYLRRKRWDEVEGHGADVVDFNPFRAEREAEEAKAATLRRMAEREGIKL